MNQDSEEKAGSQIVAEIDSSSYELSLALHNNELECRATIVPKDGGEPITPLELDKILGDAGITVGIDASNVEEFCQEANEGKTLKSVVLATGNPPEPGLDGWCELYVHSSLETTHYKTDKDDNIDYRHRHAFDNAKPDQMVGKLWPPRKGKPGKTVKGDTIASVLGNKLNLFVGNGLRLCDDGKSIISEGSGRVVYEDNTIYITDEFLVEGDVDLHVGSIDFAGFVTIKGDVLDGFNIMATKGIEIGGSVGACKIFSAGDLTIGSMYGDDVSIIKCIGNLHAHHISNLRVECDGNVIVSKEIRDSNVKSLGFVIVEDGNISGGECLAMKGIEAKNIGSPLCSPTSVGAGVSYLDADREQVLQKRLASVNSRIEQISYTLGSTLQKDLDSLSDTAKQRYGILTETLEKITKEQEVLHKKINVCLQAQDLTSANPKINVKEKLYDGVTVKLGDVSEITKFERKGPLSIIESMKDQCLFYPPMSPLSTSAEDDMKKYQEDDENEEI